MPGGFGLFILSDSAVVHVQEWRAELAAILQLLGGIHGDAPTNPSPGGVGHTPTTLDGAGNIITPIGTVPADVSEAIKSYWPREVWSDAGLVSGYESHGWDRRAIRDTLHLAAGRCNVPIGRLADGTPIVSEQSVGLFQINVCSHGHDVRYWEDIENNVRYAASLYARSGWYPWVWTATHFGLIGGTE